MFGFFARILGMMLSGLCISGISLLFFGLFLRRQNPGQGGLLRRVLRASYYLYSTLLNWVRPYVAQGTGIDLLNPVPRTLTTGSLSFGIGWGVFHLLHWQMGIWLAVLFLAHGLFVGWSWEQIILPQDFQMGARLQ